MTEQNSEFTPPRVVGEEKPHAPFPKEKLLHENKLSPTWNIFAEKLNEFGVAGEDLERFGKEFRVCFNTVESLNNGENIIREDFHFEKNNLRYHDFDHTAHVVERTLQVLPGFLQDLKRRGINVSEELSKIKGIVFASIFHDIGYLKRVKGDEVYLTQGELYFDHEDRGMRFAPEIIQHLGLDLSREDVVFTKQMIRATDFNMSWPEKEEKEGLTGIIKEWGKVLEAADFLSSFSHPGNIPGSVAGLYWENLSRVVKRGKAQKWARNNDGTLKFEDGRPVLIDVIGEKDGRDNYARIIEVKFAKPFSDDGLYYEVETQNIFEFVASSFSRDFLPKMKPYLDYTDQWSWSDGVNEVRKNYRVNNERISLLQEAAKIRETDPFSIFEGGFTGHDLHMWVDEMERQGMLPESFSLSSDWVAVDMRVLGMEEAGELLGRLVTGELREILSAVTGDKSKAIAMLLERYREKMRGENVSDVYLHVAPMAYLKEEGGPFVTLKETVEAFHNAFLNLSRDSDLPLLNFAWTVRLDRDFHLDGQIDPQKMHEVAEEINKFDRQGIISRLAFLGKQEAALEEYHEFFDSLERKDRPMVILFGQKLPDAKEMEETVKKVRKGRQERKERLIQNVKYISTTLCKEFERLAFWGLHDLVLFSDKEVEEEVNSILPPNINLLLTLTYDQLTGMAPDIKNHPLGKIIDGKPGARLIIGSGDSALTYGSSSVTLDAFSFVNQRGLPESSVLDMIASNGSF